LACESNKKENKTEVQKDTAAVTVKKDTLLLAGLSLEEMNSILSEFNSQMVNFKDSILVTKLYVIKEDTILLNKNQLRELSPFTNLDPNESAFYYRGDTLMLDNDCIGTELICYPRNLKAIYDYGFDCVEACSHDVLKYYYLNDRVMAYQDNFFINCFPQNAENAKTKSIRRETFVTSQNAAIVGIQRETIETTTGLDTIKISRANTIRIIDKQVVRKLLETQCALD
jgi:hypothetical protein